MVGRKSVILSVSVIAILVLSTVFAAIPTIPRASAQAQQANLSGNYMGNKQGADWFYTGANQWGQNYQPQNQINRGNINLLEMKWVFPWAAPPIKVGGYAANENGATASPLVVNGILYVIDNSCSLHAFNLAEGKRLWTFTPKLDFDKDAKSGLFEFLNDQSCTHLHAMSYFEGKIYVNLAPCTLYIVDAITGGLKNAIGPMCTPEFGIEGNQPPPFNGRYKAMGSYSPVFDQKRRVMILPGASTITGPIDQGRGVFFGFNVDTLQKLWTLYTCPRMDRNDKEWQQEMLRLRSEGKIWFHVGPYAGDSQPGRGINAKDLPESVIAEDWGMFSERFPGRIDKRRETGFAGTCTGQGWSHFSVDEETGTVILTTNNVTPDYNATYRPGPDLLATSFWKADVMTGKIQWIFSATTHDLWDYECAWNTIMGFADVPGKGRTKLVIKGCKNGLVHVVDHATGEPIPWVNGNPWEPPVVKRSEASRLNDPRKLSDLFERRWGNWPKTDAYVQSPPPSGGIESDPAFDPVRQTIYVGAYYLPGCQKVGPVDLYRQRSTVTVPAATCFPTAPTPEATFYAIEAGTGKIKWEFNVKGFGFRGGVVTTGDMVMFNMVNGNLYALDADTGKVLMTRYMGSALGTAPIIAADANGKMRLITYVGGQRGSGYGSSLAPTPGAVVVMGLPDKLPEPQVITKEVIKEVIKEVVKEVPKEVTKTVTVETISPVSYAAIGIGVVLVVIAGVLFTRRKKA